MSVRELLSYVCVAIFLSASEAITCSEDSDIEVCRITIKDNSTGGSSINLLNASKTLKCITCDMKVLPEIQCDSSSQVETIDFSQSRIKNIPNVASPYSDFLSVQTFNLSHNEIDQLLIKSNRLISTAVNLITLDLSYNNIQIVPTDYGPNRFTMLASLNISHNNICSLESECFKNITQLQTLNLNNNRIPSVTASIFRYLKTLIVLDLSYNAIASIDANSFLNLRKLKLLNLAGNKLSTITFDGLVSLKLLDLSKNAITIIDLNIFSGTPNLQVLNVSSNNLHTFRTQSFFTNISKLSELDISNNNITELHVYYATSLQKLNATGNRIASVHLLGASALEILDLSNNTLTEFFAIGALAALRQFRLAHNNLNSIQSILLKIPKDLKSLDLSFNSLNDINASTLSRFKDLQHLNLQNSGLRSVDSSTFAAHSHLRSLDISYNNLKFFDLKSSLPQNKNLTELFLNGNLLSAIGIEHINVTERFPSLKRIGISDNSWPCSYLHILLEHLYGMYGIKFDIQLPAGDSVHIAGIGCVLNETVVLEMNKTALNVVENEESKAQPVDTFTTVASFIRRDEPNKEVVWQQSVKEKDETIVVNHTDLEMMMKRVFDRQIQQIRVVISIWLMGIVIVLLLFTIVLYYKQRRRGNRNFEENTIMINM